MTIQADARSIPLRDGCVQCCVTSPPYWGLRDYGVVGQLGLEPTPEAYVANLVAVFREVWRVLRDDGTLWLNLGDSFANDAKWGGSSGGKHATALHGKTGIGRQKVVSGLKPKDLVGIPWRVAFALQADGWYLRSDIIWSKPNPMPESVKDRPTKAHEYLFLLTKSERYVYDAAAVLEPISQTTIDRFGSSDVAREGPNGLGTIGRSLPTGSTRTLGASSEGRNRRSVWTVTTQPYRGAHFAVMPEKLVEPCVLAGSRPGGKRCDCDQIIASPTGTGAIEDPTMTTGRAGMNRPRRQDEGTRPVTRRQQREWAKQIRASVHAAEMEREAGVDAFAHYVRTDESGARPPRPDLLEVWLSRGWLGSTTSCDCPDHPADLVLDPFAGSGTVGVVALRHGRRFVGVELNPDYINLATQRLSGIQPSVLSACDGADIKATA